MTALIENRIYVQLKELASDRTAKHSSRILEEGSMSFMNMLKTAANHVEWSIVCIDHLSLCT